MGENVRYEMKAAPESENVLDSKDGYLIPHLCALRTTLADSDSQLDMNCLVLRHR